MSIKKSLHFDQSDFVKTLIHHSSFIEELSSSHRVTTLIKDKKTGRYQTCNQALANRVGIPIADYIGLTIHDVGRVLNYKNSVITNSIEMDNRIITGQATTIRYKQVMPISDRSIYVDEIIKKPIFGHQGQIVAVFGYGRNVTPYIDLTLLFKYYQRYYLAKTAIQYFIEYLKIAPVFHRLPTKRELEVLLIMLETENAKHVAYKLALSPKTVHEHKARLRDNLKRLTLSELLMRLRFRNEYDVQGIII